MGPAHPDERPFRASSPAGDDPFMTPPEPQPTRGLGIGIGAGIGAGIGMIFAMLLGDDLGMGLAFGAGIGVLVGLMIDSAAEGGSPTA
jgi:hypothetical protein